MKAEGMSPGERVQLRVFAKNDVGRSRASAIENHAVPCALPGMPPAPTFECCDASSAKIHLCPPSNIGGGTLKGYRVELAIRSKVEKQRATSSIRLEMPEHCDYFKSNFQVGDLCDAKWKDGMYYPARIMDMLDDEPKLLEIQFGELDAADLRMSVPIESVRTRLQISEECLITYEGRPTRGVVIGTVDDKESGGYAVEILLHDELLQLEMSPQYIQRLWDHGEILRYGVRMNTEAIFLREVETKKTTTEPFMLQHEEKIRAHSESDAKILHTVPSLDPANVYATRVYFKNSAGWSEASPELQFSIGAASLPDAPLFRSHTQSLRRALRFEYLVWQKPPVVSVFKFRRSRRRGKMLESETGRVRQRLISKVQIVMSSLWSNCLISLLQLCTQCALGQEMLWDGPTFQSSSGSQPIKPRLLRLQISE